MRMLSRMVWIPALVLALAALAEDARDAQPKPATDENTPVAVPPAGDERPVAEKPAKEASRTVVYVPPSRGSARARIGGGTRGPVNAPTLAVLAPDHTGVTTRSQPTFAWFISEPSAARVDFTLIDPDAVEPVLEVTLPAPLTAGVQLVRLSHYPVQLEEGHSYDWSVALVIDPEARDLDVVAGGAVRREAASPGLVSALDSGAPSYRALARAGVWYDAMADLSDAIASDPGNAALVAERAHLLEQVGVGAVAAYERGSGPDGAEPDAR